MSEGEEMTRGMIWRRVAVDSGRKLLRRIYLHWLHQLISITPSDTIPHKALGGFGDGL